MKKLKRKPRKTLKRFDEKLERNLQIYIERKNGKTIRALSEEHGVSLKRISDLVEKVERKIEAMPEIAQLVADRLSKNL